jgi:spore maturation protein CgeB
MKILLVVNKTLTNGREVWDDGATQNLYMPLKKLGHDVYFYDTVEPPEPDFSKVVDQFMPDLIFCCLTNDRRIAAHEPWEEILKYTQSGLIKTFNWFCDDTWRFEEFSKYACHCFTACSTPEIRYIEKFKSEANYENIILGLWHSNIDLYPKEEVSKKYDIVFCGHLNHDRATYLDYLYERGIKTEYFHGLQYEEMVARLAEAKIGINFSKNHNGAEPVLQMKGRMFEVPAAKSLLLTEYAPGLENHYKIDKEVIAFKGPEELWQKAKMLLEKPELINKITANGHNRFMRDHESHVRLKGVLGEIEKI